MKPPGAYDVVGHIEKASTETQDAAFVWLWDGCGTWKWDDLANMTRSIMGVSLGYNHRAWGKNTVSRSDYDLQIVSNSGF